MNLKGLKGHESKEYMGDLQRRKMKTKIVITLKI